MNNKPKINIDGEVSQTPFKVRPLSRRERRIHKLQPPEAMKQIGREYKQKVLADEKTGTNWKTRFYMLLAIMFATTTVLFMGLFFVSKWFDNYHMDFQSPLIVQSPIIIKQRAQVSPMVVIQTVPLPTAQPIGENIATPPADVKKNP